MDIKKIKEELASLHAEATKFEETYSASEPTADEQAAQDERFAKMDRLQKQLENVQRLAKYSFEQAAPSVVKPTKSEAQQAYEAHEAKPQRKAGDKIDVAEYSAAFADWVDTGDMGEEYATITTATDSGAFLPKQVLEATAPVAGNAIRTGMALVGARVMTTESTAEINEPIILTSKGSDLGETNTGSAENGSNGASSLKKINLKPTAIESGEVWVSELELAALGSDLLAAYVPGLVDAKEMRLEEKVFAAIIADAAITQEVATATTTGFTYANLVDLNRKHTTRFDRLKVIFLSNAAYAAAEKLVGDDGHPVLTRDPQNQSLARFNGTPVLKTDYLEAFGASKVVGVAISFVGARLRDAGQTKVVRYANYPGKTDQRGMNAIGYHVFGYLPEAVAKLKTPAS